MTQADVLVRGGGAVGMAAALALSRLGLQVALQMRPPTHPVPTQDAAAPDLRAYALNAASVQLLATLKVWDAIPADARTAVHDMHVQGDAAGATLDFSAWQQSLSELAWIVDAGELDAALRSAVRFAPHIDIVQPDAAALLQPTLQVLADGKDGAARAALGVRMQPHAYGQSAIAARLHSDLPHAGLARQWLRCPDVLALLPLDRPQPGHGLALVWSLPDAQADALLALPDAAFTAELQRATAGAAGTLALHGGRARWPLALARADRVAGPGWVLVGDAAHVVHPLAGQGLNLGLADVDVLAQELAAREPWRALGDARLLARYARRRAGPVRAMATLTDTLLHLFASPAPLVRGLRNRGLTLANRLPAFKRLLTSRAVGG